MPRSTSLFLALLLTSVGACAAVDDDDDTVDDDDDATMDDDDSTEEPVVPIPAYCADDAPWQPIEWYHPSTTMLDALSGDFVASPDGLGGVFTGTDGTEVDIDGAGDAVDYPGLQSTDGLSVRFRTRYNETDFDSMGAVFAENGQVRMQSARAFWEAMPGGGYGVSHPATGGCDAVPTGAACWEEQRPIPVRFQQAETVFWLYPGQETVVNGLRFRLIKARQMLDQTKNDKCGPEFDIDWYAVRE